MQNLKGLVSLNTISIWGAVNNFPCKQGQVTTSAPVWFYPMSENPLKVPGVSKANYPIRDLLLSTYL